MHTEKIKIFDEYAQSLSVLWENFDDLLMTNIRNGNVDFIKTHLFAACDLVQKEQQKRIADNMNWDRCKNKGSECRTDKHELSILSENNLIK